VVGKQDLSDKTADLDPAFGSQQQDHSGVMPSPVQALRNRRTGVEPGGGQGRTVLPDLMGEGGGGSGRAWREAEEEELPSAAVMRLMGEIQNPNSRLSETRGMKHNLPLYHAQGPSEH
jgi:hypothetical protein